MTHSWCLVNKDSNNCPLGERETNLVGTFLLRFAKGLISQFIQKQLFFFPQIAILLGFFRVFIDLN